MSTAELPAKVKKPRARIADQPLTIPFVVVVDSREQAPYAFTGLRADKSQHNRALIVPTKIAGLHTGDYSIEGLESLVCIERKSAADLVSTLASGRDRFEAEHARMAAIIARGGLAAVVIETNWPTILNPAVMTSHLNSRLNPKTIFRTHLSWLCKYHVPWITAGDRRLGKVTTFRLLEKFWGQWVERNVERSKEAEKGSEKAATESDCDLF